MATHDLVPQFAGMQEEINLGARARIAIAAHLEVQFELAKSRSLADRGLNVSLIGSYARKVALWPGKDVDLFGLLERADDLTPQALHSLFGTALVRFDIEGRLKPQPRSYMVRFGPGRYPSEETLKRAVELRGWNSEQVRDIRAEMARGLFEISVDVVPAARRGAHYAIPEVSMRTDPEHGVVRQMSGDWRVTNPIALTKETQKLNDTVRIGGQGAYVPTVKAVKQIRKAHLDGQKPGALFYEFILFDGFTSGAISGTSWADVTHAAIGHILERLSRLNSDPVCDPILNEPYSPAPSAAEVDVAVARFRSCRATATRAVTAGDVCTAGSAWRDVLGGNLRSEYVFPMPDGCSGTGRPYGAAGAGLAANAATGGSRSQGFGGL
jgi:hypothetical protein